MNRFIAIEPDRCIGCGTCSSACHEGHERAGLQAEPRIRVVQMGEVTAALTCHQCEDAPCLAVCPVGAIVHEDTYVHVLEQQCVGCRMCAVVCPFGAIHPSGTSVAGVAGTAYDTPVHAPTLSDLLTWDPGVYTCAVKCDLCSYDPAGPHCVSACPTKALRLVTEEAGSSLADAKRLRAADAAGSIAGFIAQAQAAEEKEAGGEVR